MVIHSSLLAWETPWTEEPAGYNPRGGKESDMTERLSTSTAQHRVCSLTTLISGADENGLCALFASVGPSQHSTLFPGGMNTHL